MGSVDEIILDIEAIIYKISKKLNNLIDATLVLFDDINKIGQVVSPLTL